MKKKYALIDTWVQEAQNGDKAAMEMLVTTFKPLILSLVQRYSYETKDYEDALQDGALVVLEAVRAYDPALGVVFPFYLKNRLFHHFVNVSKRNQKQQEKECAIAREDEENSLDILGTADSPEQEVVRAAGRKARSRKLVQMIGELPVERGSVIWLFYFEGRSLREIAELQGISIGTVGSRIHRGIKQLQIRKNELI